MPRGGLACSRLSDSRAGTKTRKGTQKKKKKDSQTFASVIFILPAFRWRKLFSLHPPPLVPVDGATLGNGSCHNLVYRDVVMDMQ